MPYGEYDPNKSSTTSGYYFPGYGYPGTTYTYGVTANPAPDRIQIACDRCGMLYIKTGVGAAEVERAAELWLAGHKTAKHSD